MNIRFAGMVAVATALATTTAYAQSERAVGEVLCAYEFARATQLLTRYCSTEPLPFDQQNDEAVDILTRYIIANSDTENPVLVRYRSQEEQVASMSAAALAELCNDPTNKWLLESRATAELGRVVPQARRITAYPAKPTYGDCF